MSQPKAGTAKEKSIQDAIAEKKKKLQDLKNQSAARSAAAPTPAKRAPPGSANRQSITWNTADMDPDDLLKDVDSLLEKDTPSGVTSPASKDSKGQSVASPAPSSDSKDPPSSTTKKAQARSVTLSSTRPAHVDIAGVQRVTYDRDVQTEFQLSAADLDKKDQQVAEELRQERERLRSREQEINKIMATVSEERRKQEAAIEAAKPKDMSATDRNRIVESKEFAQFFARSSTVMERFLDLREQEYDFTVDYTADTEQKIETKVGVKVVRKYTFEDTKLGSRPVTSLNWSPKYPELLLASYMKQAEDSLSLDPDGTVLIWNLHMTSRPEYHFQCQSGILSAQFHPSNPKLIIASTWTGQIVMFDMRENKSSPVNRTSLSRGHNHPVYAMRTVPLVNRLHNIVSVSTDGHLCAWSDNSLHEPSLELDLKAIDTGDTKRGKDEVTTNSFAFPGRDTNTIVLGSDEGVLYKARLYDKPGTTEMAGIYAAAQAHDAPITGVEFHPVMPKAPSYISDLFLTSSYDWTVKLWSHRSDKPLLTFESARDYVFDVQWSPAHPALFATGDGTGRMDIWNISGDADVPEVKLQLEALPGPEGQPPAISRVRWSDDGNSIALGTSAGAVHVYAVDPSVAQPGKDTATNFFNKMQKLTS